MLDFSLISSKFQCIMERSQGTIDLAL
uniref:Uncharacterized protein n=1 Tax=Anguilla anguilla TaxID=7936 RepID=A0A0E9QEH7_ANGAN